jgi:hypothetical protein
MHFSTKNYLKSTRNHTAKHAPLSLSLSFCIKKEHSEHHQAHSPCVKISDVLNLLFIFYYEIKPNKFTSKSNILPSNLGRVYN